MGEIWGKHGESMEDPRQHARAILSKNIHIHICIHIHIKIIGTRARNVQK